MKKWKALKAAAVLVLSLSVIAGCSKEAEPANPQSNGPAAQIKTDPAHLVMLAPGWLTDEEITMYITEPLAKKYPHITMEVARGSEESLLAAGVEIDLIVVSNANMNRYKSAGFFDDLDPLLKKHSFDLSRFEPVVIDSLRNASDNKQLHAIPYAQNFKVLYYNKDLFDKFAVPYPKDGMTWDDTLAVARKLTRFEDGVQYKGIDIDFLTAAGQVGANYSDPKTKKATMQTEAWKKVFELGRDIITMQQQRDNIAGQKAFIETKTLAMWPNWNANNQMEKAQEQGLNWDMAQYPSFKDKPNISHSVDTHIAIITKTSKNKDQALQLLEVFTSDEVQTLMNQNGKLSVLKDPKIKEQFGKNQKFLAGKNVNGPFKSKALPTESFIVTPAQARGMLSPLFDSYVKGEKDINTMLREADEKINQFIQTESAK